jgi:hypothetical protein
LCPTHIPDIENAAGDEKSTLKSSSLSLLAAEGGQWRHGHAPGKLEAVLMEDENIIYIYDTLDAYLLQSCQ